MRTTFRQPPNMKGKKHYAFRCGCCWARDCRERESEREAMKQAASDIADSQESKLVASISQIAAV